MLPLPERLSSPIEGCTCFLYCIENVALVSVPKMGHTRLRSSLRRLLRTALQERVCDLLNPSLSWLERACAA